MSYHYIEVVTRWYVKCDDCEEAGRFATASKAEEFAREHIEFYMEPEGRLPNDQHSVFIVPVTVVGRNQ